MQTMKLSNDTHQDENPASGPDWRILLMQLVDAARKHGESDLAACRRLQPRLVKAAVIRVSWTPNYILGVLHGNKGMQPSPVFTDAVEALRSKPPSDTPNLTGLATS